MAQSCTSAVAWDYKPSTVAQTQADLGWKAQDHPAQQVHLCSTTTEQILYNLLGLGRREAQCDYYVFIALCKFGNCTKNTIYFTLFQLNLFNILLVYPFSTMAIGSLRLFPMESNIVSSVFVNSYMQQHQNEQSRCIFLLIKTQHQTSLMCSIKHTCFI